MEKCDDNGPVSMMITKILIDKGSRKYYKNIEFDREVDINREIARFWESIMKGEPNSKIMGPYVYGFSYKMGPDGKPVFQEFIESRINIIF